MVIIKLLLSILVLSISLGSYSQVYNGIKEVNPYEKKLARLDMYLQLNPNKCIDIYDELYVIAKKKNNKTLECILNIYMGTIHFYMSRNDSSVVYFDKAIVQAGKLQHPQLLSTSKIRRLFVIGGRKDNKLMLGLMRDEYEIAKENKDTLNMIYGLNGMAMFLENLDDTEACIQKYLEAIKLAQSSNNEFEYGFLLNNLGLLKLRLKATEEAYADFNSGIEIAKKLDNIRLELTLRENIGYYYLEIDSVGLAEKEFQDVYNIATKLNYSYIAFNSIVNLGSIEIQKENYSKSDSLLKKALEVAKRDELYYGISPILLTLAQIELGVGRYENVQPLLDSSLAYSKYTSRNDIQEGVYQITYKLHEKKGDFEEALFYYKKLENFRDSIDKDGHVKLIKELQLKYDVEKKEKQRIEDKVAYERQISEQELNAASLRQKIGTGIIVVLLLIGGLLIYYFTEKNKRESEFSSAMVNKLEEERGRIARDLHDGLGQSLVILKNKFDKLQLEPNDLTSQINNNFTETIEEVRSISRSLIPPELRRLGLLKSIVKMTLDIENSTNIVVSTDIDQLETIKLDETQEIRIYRIVQELMNNTIKHSEATSLKIEINVLSDVLTIIYQDNGKGFDADKIGSTESSIGLRSIDQRLKFLNGTIKFEKQARGLKALIKIKLKK